MAIHPVLQPISPVRAVFRLRALPALLAAGLLLISGADPSHARARAAKPGAAPSQPAAPASAAPAPVVIQIVRRIPAEERARRQREEALRRQRARPAVVAWARSYRPAVAPVRAALDEALASLAMTWGPASRNVAYPVELAVSALENRVRLPAPDPDLDLRLERALFYLKEGATACRNGLPTVAQLHLHEGRGWLDLVDEILRSYGKAEEAKGGGSPRPVEPAGARESGSRPPRRCCRP